MKVTFGMYQASDVTCLQRLQGDEHHSVTAQDRATLVRPGARCDTIWEADENDGVVPINVVPLVVVVIIK